MKYQFRTGGRVCAQAIEVELENDRVKHVEFIGGCPGNHLGIGRLVENMPVNDVIARLSGVDCGGRGTSCPDQLACALKVIRDKERSAQK